MNAIVIVEKSELRQQIKRILSDVEEPEFALIKAAGRLVEGLERMREYAPFSFVIVSSNYPKAELASFMEQAKSIAPSATFVLFSRDPRPDRETVSSAMFLGFHGVVREPLCMAAIEHVIQLMPAMRKTNTYQRLRTATGLLLASLLDETKGRDVDQPVRRGLFEEAEDCCRRFKDATGESVTTAVVAQFGPKPIPNRMTHYQAICSRLRQVFSGKSLAPSEVFTHFKNTLRAKG